MNLARHVRLVKLVPNILPHDIAVVAKCDLFKGSELLGGDKDGIGT